MKSRRILIFLLAAFSMTQVKIVGYIGISEIAILIFGPFVLFKNWNKLQRDGFMPFLMLAGLWAASALITDYVRETPLDDMLKGIASPVMVIMAVPCFYALLSKDIVLFKWAILGFTVTVFLSIYVIQTGTAVANAEKYGIEVAEAAQGWKLAFKSQVTSVAKLIPVLYYLSYPVLSVLVTLGLAVFSLFEGGRGGFLCILCSAGIMMIAGGSRKSIHSVSRKFMSLILVMVALAFLAKEGYEFTVKHGYLGEEELSKYELQSASKIGLLSGRSQFVTIYYAIRDSPVLGHGSWALDTKGYNIRAMEWLQEDEELKQYYRSGATIKSLSGHSHLMTAYVWHGFLGAVFWFYVLMLCWKTLSQRLGTVPEFFGYLAFTLPNLIFSILFSPFGGRVGISFVIVICLLVRREHELHRKHKASLFEADGLAGFRSGMRPLTSIRA